MSASYHPDMCKRVAFRHTVLMTLACCLGPAVNCTTEMFILYSLPCNLWGVYLGWKFYTDGDSQSARKLFRFSLYQMPYLILMMILSKKWKTEEKTKHSESDILNKAVTWTKAGRVGVKCVKYKYDHWRLLNCCEIHSLQSSTSVSAMTVITNTNFEWILIVLRRLYSLPVIYVVLISIYLCSM